jgi:hypothetical protein
LGGLFISSYLTDEDSMKALHIYLGFKRGSKFEDETGEKCSIHDTQDKIWRYLNFFEHTCLLTAIDLRNKLFKVNGLLVCHLFRSKLCAFVYDNLAIFC